MRFPLGASWRFWLGNCAAWLALYSAQSLIDALDGAPFNKNLLRYIPEITFALFAGLIFHHIFTRHNLSNQKPASVIFYICLYSLLFALTTTLLFAYPLASQITDICQPGHPRAPDFMCGRLANQFGHSLSNMLIWQLLYLAIHSEQTHLLIVSAKWTQWIAALGCLIALSMLRDIFYVIGWSSSANYLFSAAFAYDTISSYFVAIALAAFVMLICPSMPRLNSYVLPWIPIIITLALFGTAAAIMADGIAQRAYFILSTSERLNWNLYWILLGEHYGQWNSRGQFGGSLQGKFTNILTFSLVYLYIKRTCSWRLGESQDESSSNTTHLHVTNILFWSFFSALIYATDLMNLSEFGKSVPSVSTYTFIFTGYCLGLILHSQVVVLAKHTNNPMRLGTKIIAISLLTGSLLTCSLWLINFAFIYIIEDGFALNNYTTFVQSRDYVLASYIVACMTCGLWCLISYMTQAQKLQKDATISHMQLQMNLKEVQLAALAGKIDPHFIFNALNNIRALIDEDKTKARHALTVLSELLRSPLNNSASDKICVKDELQLVSHYVSLAQIHFEERLNFQYSISDDAVNAAIPAMMLQILVENAIKHGISQLPDGGDLSIDIVRQSEQLICTVKNTGQLGTNPQTAGFGLGLKTITQRLKLLYSNNAQFELRQSQTQVIAQLHLPFEPTYESINC